VPTYNLVGQIVSKPLQSTNNPDENSIKQEGFRIPPSVWGFKNMLSQRIAANKKQVNVLQKMYNVK